MHGAYNIKNTTLKLRVPQKSNNLSSKWDYHKLRSVALVIQLQVPILAPSASHAAKRTAAQRTETKDTGHQ
jgi:hypothetical protein